MNRFFPILFALLMLTGSMFMTSNVFADENPYGAGFAEQTAETQELYALTATERPDLSKMTEGSWRTPHHGTLPPSVDGFIVYQEYYWGDYAVWTMAGDEEPSVGTFTLLGSEEVILYIWEASGQSYFAFADGPIFQANDYEFELLAVEPFNNRIRITIHDAEKKPLASREFTVVGVKPAKSAVE